MHSVEYEIPVSQIEALILMSGECEQYVRYVIRQLDASRKKNFLNLNLISLEG